MHTRKFSTSLFIRAFLVTVASLSVNIAQANMNVTVKGNILAGPPCVINNNQDIEVNFGSDLYTTKVDGSNYRRAIVYTLNCNSASSQNLKLSIQGTDAGYDNALATDKNDLGIKFYINSAPYNINTWYNFTYNAASLPMIEAVPVRRSGSSLTGGDFSVNATLVIELQ